MQKQKPMYEKRNEEIISPKGKNPTKRIARFLKPFAKKLNQVVGIPKTPLLSDIFTHKNQQKWPLEVHFNGWKKPQKDWKKWYDRLLGEHASTWIKAGIMDGIQASLHEIPCNKDLVLGVCEFWCSKTNTFIFPWGEATVTLEDVMILGGFPVIGAPIDQSVGEEYLAIVQGLSDARFALAKGGEKEVTHSAWIEHFMEEEEEGEIENQEGKFEHVAFLSLWLSRFVFPDGKSSGIIGRNVFSIATHLSQGTPIAIAPVVLANLYHELSKLTQKAVDLPLKSEVYISGLFQIVQLWVCERFPGFGGPNLAKPLELGDPRVARWDKVDFEVTLSLVRSRLKLGEDFQWRPYACDLENWDHLPYYEETEQTFSKCSGLDECFLSFARFLHSSELIGIDCVEKYNPSRVAMQFGYDQDIPAEVGASTSSWDKGGLYVPSRTFEPGVSKSYHNWWKDTMLHREEAVMDVLAQSKGKGIEKVEGGLRISSKVTDKGGSYVPSKAFESGASKRYYNALKDSRLGREEADTDALARSKKSKGIVKVEGKQPDEEVNGSKKDEIDENGDSSNSDLDHVPLALRMCSTVSKGKKHVCPDSLDIDHDPLALRTEKISRREKTCPKPQAASGNGKNPPHNTQELASQKSYADSQITSRNTSSTRREMRGDQNLG